MEQAELMVGCGADPDAASAVFSEEVDEKRHMDELRDRAERGKQDIETSS